MGSKKFGFGIVGAGIISHFHAGAIRERKNAQLLGIYSTNKIKSDQFAAKYKCEAYDTLNQMLSRIEIDIVCICTPSGTHLEPGVACIQAGKHCVIEKPLEITIERYDKIIEAAQKASVKTAVIFPSRFNVASKQLKKSIVANHFSDLVLSDAYVKWSRSAEYYRSGKWRGSWKYDGGDALMNQGIHSVDVLQWYMVPVESVQSVCTNVWHKNIEVEDTIVSTIKYKNGALGTIECSTGVFPGAIKRIEIMGTRGTAI